MSKVWGIVGSRDFHERDFLFEKLDLTYHSARVKPAKVVSGGATGADYHAISWAAAREIPWISHIPDWKTHGRAAGPIRNRLIVEDSDHIIAFIYSGRLTKGTASTLKIAEELGVNRLVFEYNPEIHRCRG